MTKNRVLFWIFAFLASVAITLGLCLLFLGSKNVDIVPKSVKVELIDGNYYLSTDYNAEYFYQFKLEQQFDDEYVVLDTVDSKNNLISLKDSQLDIVPGQIYRFSARYITENGSSDTDFSDVVVWQAETSFSQVKNVAFDAAEEKLSWDENGAEFYVVNLLDKSGQVTELSTAESEIDLCEIEVGAYNAYVLACSSNEFVKNSVPSESVSVVVSRKNNIISAIFDKGNLIVTCSEKVKAFSIEKSGQQLAIVEVVETILSDANGWTYELTGAQMFMQEGAQIKSVQTEFVFESDLILIEQ